MANMVTNVNNRLKNLLKHLRGGGLLGSVIGKPGYPTRKELADAMAADDNFATLYNESRRIGYETIAENVFGMAQTEPERFIDKVGNQRIDPYWIAWTKTRSDIVMKLLSKWAPERYGDQINLGAGGVVVNVNTGVPRVIEHVKRDEEDKQDLNVIEKCLPAMPK